MEGLGGPLPGFPPGRAHSPAALMTPSLGAHATCGVSSHRPGTHGSHYGPVSPRWGLAAYLALATHSRVISLDPATTLLLPGGITMTGAVVSGAPSSPVAEKAQVRGALLSMEGVSIGNATNERSCQATLIGHLRVSQPRPSPPPRRSPRSLAFIRRSEPGVETTACSPSQCPMKGRGCQA